MQDTYTHLIDTTPTYQLNSAYFQFHLAEHPWREYPSIKIMAMDFISHGHAIWIKRKLYDEKGNKIIQEH